MNNELKPRIMRQIYVEFLRQRALSVVNSPLFALGVFAGAFAMSVSLPHVVSNLSHTSTKGIPAFLYVAVRDTEAFVKVILAGLAAAAVGTGWMLVRKMRPSLGHWSFRFAR